MIAVNLIPMSRRVAAARRRRIRRWSAAGVAYAAVLAAVCVLSTMGRQPGGPSLDSRIREVAAQAEQSDSQTRMVLAELDAIQGRLRAMRRIMEHPDWSVLLGLVSGARSGQIVFDLCEVEPVAAPPSAGSALPAEYLLRLSGIARQQQEVPKFVLRLEALGLFSRVTLLESQNRPLDETQVYSFRIECSLRDSGGRKP